MKLKEFQSGQSYADILLMLSEHITKTITESNSRYCGGNITRVINLSPKKQLTYNSIAKYADGIIVDYSYRIVYLDKDTMSKQIFSITYRLKAGEESKKLNELDHGDFIIDYVSKYTYNHDLIDFDKDHTRSSEPFNLKLIDETFEDIDLFLIDQEAFNELE